MDKKSLLALETFATVPADLNVLVEYHKPSSIYLNESTKKKYTKKVKLYIMMVDKASIHPAYNYTKVVDRTFPKPYNKTVSKTTFNTFFTRITYLYLSGI